MAERSTTWNGSQKKAAGQVLMKCLQAADKKRTRWFSQGQEVWQYGYLPTHDFQYQSIPADAFFKSKEALTSESIRLMGPYLYQQNPHRTVTVKDWAAPIIQDSTPILGDYLNYSLAEYDAYANARRWVDQSIVWGRAVRWTARHPKKPEIICSLWDDVRNFWDDPDADIPENRRIVFRRRWRPRDEVIAEYPEFEKEIKSVPKKEGSTVSKQDGELTAFSGMNCIEYYEAYSIVALDHFQGGDALREVYAEQDSPAKYLFTKEGRFIGACDWEVPFFIDGTFPVTILDYYDYPGSLWPVSPLEPGLNYLRALNWLSTLMMGRMRRYMRYLGAIAKSAGEGLSDTNEDQVLMGSDVEMLMLDISAGKIGDFIQESVPNAEWIGQGLQYRSVLEDRYRKATGAYDILYYGQTDTQSRTATDAQMKDRNSRSRIEDMRDKIIKAETELARKDALAARFLLTREEIGKVMGPESAARWGFLQGDQQAQEQMFQGLMAEGYDPQMAAEQVQQAFAQAVDLKAWAAETGYGIEADSIRRRDVDQQIDLYKELANQWAPTLIQSPDPQQQAIGFLTQAAYLKASGADQDLVRRYKDMAAKLDQIALMPPPPPADTGGPIPGPGAMPQGAMG